MSCGEIDAVLAATADPAGLTARGIEFKHDATGLSCELPVEGDTTLSAIVDRIHALVRSDNEFGGTLRFRRYEPGEGHPAHRDEYRIRDLHLIATAMLHLVDTEEGGETAFPLARPEALRVEPRAGRLVLWFNHRLDGSIDPLAEHEGLPIVRGRKITLTEFIYKPLGFAALDPLSDSPFDPAAQPAETPKRAKFVCVNDGVPSETTDLLRKACDERNVAYVEIDAQSFDFDPERQLSPGDLLYRPAVSTAASRVEQFLFAPGVATFYKNDDDMFFDSLSYPLHFQRAGLPVPRTVFCANADRTLLKGFVEQLGGFPVVVKMFGSSGGVGVMKVESFPGLYSLMDYASWQGKQPLLSAYIEDAIHWRVIVVGERAVAAYKNVPEVDDFRTYGGDDPADVTDNPDPRLAAIAVKAVHVLHNEFGGVDILEHSSGRLYLLEANFPCYFPHAQLVAGIDISGAMIDYLLKKASGSCS